MTPAASLFPTLTARFPSTRYQGSKAKLAGWIWRQVAGLEFETCADLFGGTGAVAHRLKLEGKRVTYNDALKFNHLFGRALIENSLVRLEPDEIDRVLSRKPGRSHPSFVQDTFHDIYFTDEENEWIDRTFGNIRESRNPYKHALAFFALCQACMVKRPYNLFHRKNLYIRQADVERSFGNKTSWDRPFEHWFRAFAAEANDAVFDNGHENRALNLDAAELPGDYDLVYIDPPYTSSRGVSVDYLDFYHFLEGLARYDVWGSLIDFESKHRRLRTQPSDWTDKSRILSAFERVFARYQDSIIVVSYRSDGIPSEPELVGLLRQYKRNVRAARSGKYKYVLSKNGESSEILLIGA
jgi:adenine-specific DNA methylase